MLFLKCWLIGVAVCLAVYLGIRLIDWLTYEAPEWASTVVLILLTSTLFGIIVFIVTEVINK